MTTRSYVCLQVSCFGADECHALAFGVPGVLMLVALVLFLMGINWYRIVPAEKVRCLLTLYITFLTEPHRFTLDRLHHSWLKSTLAQWTERGREGLVGPCGTEVRPQDDRW